MSRAQKLAVALAVLAAPRAVSAHPLSRSEPSVTAAAHLAPRDGEVWSTYTTTWTDIETLEKVYTSTVTVGTDAGTICVPENDLQEACGTICCASYQTCAWAGQCQIKEGYTEPTGAATTATSTAYTTITTDGVVTTMYSQPWRVTSSTFDTGTSIPTATVEPINDGEDGLSGGEIAGIVVGVLAGIALLVLLCFCCVVRGLWHAMCGGGGKKDKRKDRVEVVEERYSRRGSRAPSAYTRRGQHDKWYGSSSADSQIREKKKGGNKTLGALTTFAGTMAALLFLKKDKKHDHRSTRRTAYSDTYSRTSSPMSKSTIHPGLSQV